MLNLAQSFLREYKLSVFHLQLLLDCQGHLVVLAVFVLHEANLLHCHHQSLDIVQTMKSEVISKTMFVLAQANKQVNKQNFIQPFGVSQMT